MGGDRITIAQAAKLLGVHKNTVRNRIKSGKYKAEKIISEQGELYLINRDSLEEPPPYNNDVGDTYTMYSHPQQSSEQTAARSNTERRDEVDQAVQRLLTPFIEELGEIQQELGRERERRENVEVERDELRRRVKELEDSQRRDTSQADPREETPRSEQTPSALVSRVIRWARGR